MGIAKTMLMLVFFNREALGFSLKEFTHLLKGVIREKNQHSEILCE